MQAAAPQAQTLAEVVVPEEGSTISMSHDALKEALVRRATQATPRPGKLVHASIVASHKSFAPNLRTSDSKLRVLTPDASEFTPVAKSLPDIVDAVCAWKKYALDKLQEILVRYNDRDMMRAIQVSTYNTARMVFGMYGMMCQVNSVVMNHMVTSDVLFVYAAKGERR